MQKEDEEPVKEKGKPRGFCHLVGTFSDEERVQVKEDFEERRMRNGESIRMAVLRSAKRSEPVIIREHEPIDRPDLIAALKEIPRRRRARLMAFVLEGDGYLRFTIGAIDDVHIVEVSRPVIRSTLSRYR